MLNVCDLSSNNSSAVINKAIAENDCVIVKATEGKSYKNPLFEKTIDKALESGKKIGIYHYARPENNNVYDEVWNFLKAVSPYIGNAILVLDWEGKALNCSSLWALTWLRLVYAITGVKPIIYVSEAYISKVKNVASEDYGLWVAKYSKKTPVISPWKIKAMWQYADKPYDKSYFYGTAKTWDAYSKRN